MTMIQQELKPQPQPPEEDLDELYEEEPRRRPWAAILSIVLALAVIFVGYQWQQAAGREQLLASQVHTLRAEAETLRLRAEEAQRDVEGLQKKLTALAADRGALVERVATLERTAQERAAAIRAAAAQRSAAAAAAARERARAMPVVHKKTR